jgi:hypothetical protein
VAKQQHIDVCTELRQLTSDDETLSRVIAGDLAPCDFFLLPKIKLIQAELQRVLDTVTEKDFQEAFQKQRRRWDGCLHAGGNYFEGDGGR